jgi:hypothetical protein
MSKSRKITIFCADCPRQLSPVQARRCADTLCNAAMCSACRAKNTHCSTGRHFWSMPRESPKDKRRQSDITEFMVRKKSKTTPK